MKSVKSNPSQHHQTYKNKILCFLPDLRYPTLKTPSLPACTPSSTPGVTPGTLMATMDPSLTWPSMSLTSRCLCTWRALALRTLRSFLTASLRASSWPQNLWHETRLSQRGRRSREKISQYSFSCGFNCQEYLWNTHWNHENFKICLVTC